MCILAEYLKENYAKSIDLRIYDDKRVIKVPYSLSIYDRKQAYVCLEFESRKEIETMEREDFKPKHWIGNIRKRTTKYFNTGNTIQLLSDLYGKKK